MCSSAWTEDHGWFVLSRIKEPVNTNKSPASYIVWSNSILCWFKFVLNPLLKYTKSPNGYAVHVKYVEFRVFFCPFSTHQSRKIIRQDGDLPEAIRIFESEGGDVGWRDSHRSMRDLPRNKGGMMGKMVDLWDLPRIFWGTYFWQTNSLRTGKSPLFISEHPLFRLGNFFNSYVTNDQRVRHLRFQAVAWRSFCLGLASLRHHSSEVVIPPVFWW
jgi:hypothetical protein